MSSKGSSEAEVPEEDTSEFKLMEERITWRVSLMADRKIDKVEMESLEVMCNTSIPSRSGEGGTDKPVTTKAADL